MSSPNNESTVVCEKTDVFVPRRTTQRESGLELLRIIAMFLIVMHHVSIHGGVTIQAIWDKNIIFGLSGKLGVNVFVLISAYFMINKKFKITRILNLVLHATFYSFVIYLIFVIFGGIEFSWFGFVSALLPVLYSTWWFVTAFVILVFLSPVLNLVIRSVPQKTFRLCLCLMLICTIMFPYFSTLITGRYVAMPYFNDVFVFVELYCVSAYIRLYGLNLSKFIIILTTCLVLLGGFLITFLYPSLRSIVWKITSLTSFVGAIGLFLIFKDFKFHNRAVNWIAATTFGIYLIHENPYVRNWVYQFCREIIFPWCHSSILLLFLSAIIIFVVSMIIEFVYLLTMQRLNNCLLLSVDKKLAQRNQNKSEPSVTQ